MGTLVYFLSCEFTYHVASPPMASVTTISSRYPLLNPKNIGRNHSFEGVASAAARRPLCTVHLYYTRA